MKKFSSLFFAAVLGSVFTLAAFYWVSEEKKDVKLEYAANVPASKVAYTTSENGQAVALDFSLAAEKVMPAVVHIRSTQEHPVGEERMDVPEAFRDMFAPRQHGPSQSSGSGVIINKDGYIVTNNHVVDNADVVDVTLTDNRSYKATVIGTDPDTDLALIKIDGKDLPSLAFVDSDQAKVGQWVLAVGNPFNLTSTVTAGIISAKGRSINILNRNTENGNTAIESFIQTDAAINPGNSGGALVNLEGGLVGINTAIASQTGTYSGYGFAVPSDIVSKVVEDLIRFGTVQRGWLGVSIGSVNSQLAAEKNLAVNEGAYISGFPPKSAAREAGLKEGDVVVRINETPIRTNNGLIEFISRRRPGDNVSITVNRGGKEFSYPVILKNKDGNTGNVKAEVKDTYSSLGVEVENLDANVLKKLDISSGVRIKSLGNGKLVKSTDIREGFIVTKVNDVAVKSVKEFNDVLKKKRAGDMVIFSGQYENSAREFNYAFRM